MTGPLRSAFVAIGIVVAAPAALAVSPERVQHARNTLRAPLVDVAALRTALADLARRGPVGDRKVKISYRVAHPGVRLSPGLRRRYPDAITIVLQHRFARLSVSEAGFAVDLWFKGRRERVVVPFAAIIVVQDTRVDHEADV